MKKAELIKATATATGNTSAKVAENLEAAFGIVSATVSAGEDVVWPGFGTFTLKAVKARTGRNPRTGESIQIPAKNLVKFKSSGVWDKKSQ